MNNLRTLVIGASENPSRYSYLAIHKLRKFQHDVIALAKREGVVADVKIQKVFPEINIHTVTMYVGPPRQEEYYDLLIVLNPKRVIFNPGTENPELEDLLQENGIETLHACTLVMLNTGQY